MQKLLVEQQNALADASPVCNTASSGLNREETLSGQNRRLANNNSEENQQSGKTEQDLRVPVLNMRGEPLMPTKPER